MRPDRLLIVGFALALALFVSLGTWQLWRADQRAARLEAFAQAGESPALVAPIGADDFEQLRYRWLELRGRYLSSRQILLDSMTHEGRAGYHVLTPFRWAENEPWAVVNRGWVAADSERRSLPGVDVDESVRVIRARIDALPVPGLTLDDSEASAGGWPRVLLFPTIADLEAHLDNPIVPYQLLLSPDAPDGHVRAWRPRMMPPERHIGYAIQWYSFALVLGAIGAVLWWRARKTASVL